MVNDSQSPGATPALLTVREEGRRSRGRGEAQATGHPEESALADEVLRYPRSMRKFLRAFFSAFGSFANQHLVATLFIVLFSLGVLLAAVAVVSTAVEHLMETPAQTQARLKIEEREAAERNAFAALSERIEATRRAEQQNRETERRERTKMFCKLESVCSRYGEVRQECATAGNFDNCIRVKMGDAHSSEIESCTNDGKLAYVSQDESPNRVECFLVGVNY
jgi:hypothetical protein